MNISGIRPLAGINDYNSIRDYGISDEKSSVQAAGVTEHDSEVQQETDAAKARQTFGAQDYAKQYQSDVSYEMKGSDSDLLSLDIEKAISDMKKDQVLQQYQFFVGESVGQERVITTGDASEERVRADQNFDIA